LAGTLVAHDKPILRPLVSENFDYEGELAIIIGRSGRHLAEADALDHIFGYSCFMDGSVRDYQFDHSVAAGKNFTSTAGFGPWIVTADEVGDPSALEIATRLSGKEVQRGHTSDMLFGAASLVAYLSRIMPLEPGDVIATGTPEGVGFARKPPLWMRPGDVVEVEISAVGMLRNLVEQEVEGPR
jgi:2-keto-4-pentenoate hydratase/2-oxohepta-3-ene-1,7-dioic acid hydratase in catechol pathway